MTVQIEEHAVKQYVKRVLGREAEDVTPEVLRAAYLEIYATAKDPDWIYHEKKEMAPIHVRGDIAVPVGTRTIHDSSRKLGEGRIVPYETLRDDLTVPTVYDAETFERKRDGETSTAAA